MQKSDPVLDEVGVNEPLTKGVKVMTILAYVGNSVWGFLFFLLFIACLINGTALFKNQSFDYVFGGPLLFFLVLSSFVLVVCILSVLGIRLFKKGMKKGFVMYAIANGLWALLLFYAGTDEGGIYFIITGVISVLFIGYFGRFYAELK